MKKTTQNLWDTSKAVLSGKFIVIHIIHSDTQAIFKKQGKVSNKHPNLPAKNL